MIFGFDIESSYNVPNFDRGYTIDITNERLQKQMNYEHIREFNKIHASLRHSTRHIVEGTVIAEMTFENEAWSWITGCVLGTRTEIDGYEFSTSNNAWGILIGYLDAGLSADSTSFTINEDVAGVFDNVDAVIINDEFITISAISNGSVTGSNRGQEGTVARVHQEKDLVYGVQLDASRKIVLTHRTKTNSFYQDNISLSAVLDRGGILFGYSGLKIEEISFNFRVYDPIVTHVTFMGADSTNDISLLDPGNVDNNDIIALEDIKVYSEHNEEQMRQFYIEMHNSLTVGSSGFGSVPQALLNQQTSTYGVLTWTFDSLQTVLEYEQNTKRNYSVSLGKGNYRMIFALNNVRVNTVSHYRDGELIIQDSAPWYSYENPVIMYQF
jgi:hypothetical protein